MDIATPERRPLSIVVPFYRNASTAESLFGSLESVRDELASLGCTLIVVNDSPEDRDLGAVLKPSCDRLARAIPCELIKNPASLGFIQSVNIGLRLAVERKHDVLLLNSDTILSAGALTEMQRVAYADAMIGFVSPRSNNATICSLPRQREYHKTSPAESHAIFRQLSPLLPDYHFVPSAVGFCLFIKYEVLEEFGLLDEAYGTGYNEENDLIMRANRCGYRAALANHAFVYHVGEVSFSTRKRALDERNAALLENRYPEYRTAITRYSESAHHEAECMLTGLVADAEGRRDIVFDLSTVGPYYNGTFEAVKQLLRRAPVQWRDRFHVWVMVSDAAMRFHGLDAIPGLFFTPPDSHRLFALAFRFGQPFHFEQTIRLSRIGVVNVYAMLDPIALDCHHLNDPDLNLLWGSVFSCADAVTYISDFTAEQFRHRFRRHARLRELVSYLSLDLRDYAPVAAAGEPPGRHILIVGNHFAHKYVEPTVTALKNAFPSEKIVALGLAGNAPHGVVGYGSGHLSGTHVDTLFGDARFIVFPSFYEGFGLPALEGLARRKPVLARNIPVMRDLRERLGAHENLHLYDCTRDLVCRLREGFPVWKEGGGPRAESAAGCWDAEVQKLGEFFSGLIDAASFDALVSRIEHFRFLERYVAAPETRRVSDLAAIVKDREAQIADLRQSLSWRITAPLRAFGNIYLKLTRT